jgi:hypothetical protein
MGVELKMIILHGSSLMFNSTVHDAKMVLKPGETR